MGKAESAHKVSLDLPMFVFFGVVLALDDNLTVNGPDRHLGWLEHMTIDHGSESFRVVLESFGIDVSRHLTVVAPRAGEPSCGDDPKLLAQI